jgi:tRNA-2-methylthio-N6-dimethylallyladenosine synthase
MKTPGRSESPGRYLIETWGCQMNTHDSEKLAGILEELGYRPSPDPDQADIILLNTCSIREKAEEKIFSRLGAFRRIKEVRPSLIVGVCGCVAQQEGERIFRRSGLADLVLGPRAIASLPALLEQVRRDRTHAIDLGRRSDSILFPGNRARRAPGPRAYLTVMEGCNKTCSYCIVPTTRGREISKEADEVLREAMEIAAAGYRELELLGQNVNAYRSGQLHLDGLLRRLQHVEGISRLRFTTSHPAHLSGEIIRAMGDCPTVCEHLHLPVQSGSDPVLERMQRGYTRRRYLDRVDRLRASIPGIALSTDIIVGYPDESPEEFRDSLSLLREVEFDQVYSFLFSPRPGTSAAEQRDSVTPEEKAARLAELQAMQQEIQARANRRLLGTKVEVLVDGASRQGRGQLKGRTRTNRVVNFDGEERLVGEFAEVEITSACPNSLGGRFLAAPGLDLAGVAVYK